MQTFKSRRCRRLESYDIALNQIAVTECRLRIARSVRVSRHEFTLTLSESLMQLVLVPLKLSLLCVMLI